METVQHSKLVSPTELVRHVVRQLGGYPPMSIVVVGMNDALAPVSIARVSMGASPTKLVTQALAAHATRCAVVITGRLGVTGALPYSTAQGMIQDVMASFELPIIDALYVKQEAKGHLRWWSYLCDDAQCCDPDGVEVEV